MRTGPIHHVGYVVDDLEAGIERFVHSPGAGPFFVMEHLAFDEVTFLGRPAVYDHSSAFGAWGPLTVELTEVHAAHPAGLAEALVKPGGGVGHVAWLSRGLGRARTDPPDGVRRDRYASLSESGVR